MAIIAQFVQDLSHDYSHDSQFLITNLLAIRPKTVYFTFLFYSWVNLKIVFGVYIVSFIVRFFYLCVQYFEMHPYVLINELTYLPSDTWNCILRYLNFKGFKALSRIKMCTSNLDFQEEFIEIMLKFHV